MRALMVTRRAPGRVRNHTPTTAHPLFRLACEFVKRAELHRAKAGAVNSAAGSEERGNRFREVQSRCRRTARGKCGAWCVGVDGDDDGAFLRAVVRQRQAVFELFAVGTHVLRPSTTRLQSRWNGCTYEVPRACKANLLTVEVRPARSCVDVRSNWSRVPIPTPSNAT